MNVARRGPAVRFAPPSAALGALCRATAPQQAQLRAASAARMLTGLMGCYYFKKYHAVPYTLRGDQGQGEAGIF